MLVPRKADMSTVAEGVGVRVGARVAVTVLTGSKVTVGEAAEVLGPQAENNSAASPTTRSRPCARIVI
jgi:hypothetical protein